MKKYFYSIMMIGVFMAAVSACQKKHTAAPSVKADTVAVNSNAGNLGNMQIDERKVVSKGVIKSVTDIAIYTDLQEKVLATDLKEAQTVKKGQVLLRMDDTEIQNEIAKAQNYYRQAEYQYAEVLIGQGYMRSEFDKVPENIKEQAMTKCNLHTASLGVELAKRKLSKTIVTAPISGTVTQVKIHQYERPTGDAVCHIIDPNNLMVEFHVLETELNKIKRGSKVSVTSVSYPNEHHEAIITNLGVMVDENGMLMVTAKLLTNNQTANTSDANPLLPGMTAIVNF